MKTLKYILIFLLIALIGIIVAAMVTQESDYDHSNSKVIDVSPEVASAYISDLKTWESWGPWKEEMPDMQTTYGDVTQGKDASMSWTGGGDEGSLTISEYNPGANMMTDLNIGGSKATGYWNFEPEGEGTKVTWGMKGNKNLMFKIICLFMDFEGNMTDMQTKGLDNIAEQIKNFEGAKAAPSYKLSELESMEMEEKQFIGYRLTSTMEGIMANFQTHMPKAGKFAFDNKIENYVPGAVWHVWDTANNNAEYTVGLVVENSDKLGEGMEKLVIPAGKVLKVSKWGPYGTGDKEAHDAIGKYMAENGLEHVLTWEEYPNDPMKVKPEEIQTDVYYAVK